MDKLRVGRGTRLTMGNALAARLLRSALDAKITLWPNTAARRLVVEDGRVTGLVVQRGGQEVTITARKGVVLACGGFSGSPEMRKKHFPAGEQHISMVSDANTGDGLSMAIAAGGVMQEDNARNASYTAVSTWLDKSGFLQKCPHFFTDIPKPGCIAVNVKGERFGDEAGLELGAAMNDSGSVPAWLICDKAFIHRNGMGLVYPFGIRLGKMRRAGYLHEGKTLTELAGKIGVDAAGLEKTVARNNEFAKTGIDLDFGKGSTPLGRGLGDPAHKPNPCIGPIATAPFYAVRIVPGDVSSAVGLKVNTLAQPVDARGDAIPGLYVCGLDMNSLWSGTGFANGAFHAQNMTFGYIIGRELAKETAVPF
jgi:succinate dehydrogenase/fumarate reductase flavoprotein subunit